MSTGGHRLANDSAVTVQHNFLLTPQGSEHIGSRAEMGPQRALPISPQGACLSRLWVFMGQESDQDSAPISRNSGPSPYSNQNNNINKLKFYILASPPLGLLVYLPETFAWVHKQVQVVCLQRQRVRAPK